MEVLDFLCGKFNIAAMGNEKFDDIAVLKTLAQLRSANLLHPEDEAELIKQLRSDWGRSAAKNLLANKDVDFAERSVLRRFSSAF